MKELTVRLNDNVVVTGKEIEDTINGVSNQQSGAMSLKAVAQRENLKTNEVFNWCRKMGWLEEHPEVTGKAFVDWCQPIGFDSTIRWQPENILLQEKNNTIFVNTNAFRYVEFIEAMRAAGIQGGYNREVKEMEFKPTWQQRAYCRGLDLKVAREFKI